MTDTTIAILWGIPLTYTTMAAIAGATVVLLAFWIPAFFAVRYLYRSHSKLGSMLTQGEQIQAHLQGMTQILTTTDAANDRRLREVLAELLKTRTILENSSRESTLLGRELHQVVKEADGSFRHLADSLRDLDTLQQMAGHVERFCLEMASASAKIESQLTTAGQVLAALHGVVEAWSKERAPLESQTEALAREIEKALNFERQERHQLRLDLNALLLASARSANADA